MRRVWFVSALAVAVLSACARPPAPTPAPGPIPAGIVWWPADPADAMNALGGDMEDCLCARIREVAPEIVVTRQRAIRDALFPLLEPATQPATEEAFATLLARDDVRTRLARRGLRYLVAFTGGTIKAEPGGFVLCGGYEAGGCLGFSWQREATRLDAALWSLDSVNGPRRESAKSEGAFVMPAFLLPVPIPARTKADACRELGSRIAIAIRQTAAERGGKR
jgi:hypothetical protein